MHNYLSIANIHNTTKQKAPELKFHGVEVEAVSFQVKR